jgi:5-methylcytosine-specific restriction endonuclease McrA
VLNARNRYKNNPEKMIATVRKYQTSEKGKVVVKINNQKRRSRESEAPNTLTREEWLKCLFHFNHECCYCGNKKKRITHEHFIPLSKGGEYSKLNVLPVCSSCNSSKRDKDFLDWYQQQEFYSEKREKKILKYLGYNQGEQQMALF